MAIVTPYNIPAYDTKMILALAQPKLTLASQHFITRH